MKRVLLFDMDGVLVDSKEAWFHAFHEAGNISREDFERRFWGRDLKKNLQELNVEASPFCRTVYRKHLDKITLFPDTRDALGQLRWRKAVITNTVRECTDLILKRFGLDVYFEVIITSDQVEKGKPDPSIVIKACNELGVSPREAVLVGDSENDMKAGKAAGCTTVGLRVEGDYTISRLSELPSLLSRLDSNPVK